MQVPKDLLERRLSKTPRFQDMPILVTEGEMDAVAAIEVGFERTISVPNGAESNLDFMAEQKLWALLKSAKRIILAGETGMSQASPSTSSLPAASAQLAVSGSNIPKA